MELTNGTGRLPFKTILIQRENPLVEDPSDGNNKRYNRPTACLADEEWHLGWTDGRLGRSPLWREAQVEAEARLALAAQVAGLQQKLSTKKAEQFGLQQRIGQLTASLAAIRPAFEEMQAARLKRPLEFSTPLGVVLLTVALVLWIADMPLSLRLVAQGLNIPTKVEYPAGSAHYLQVNDLFHAPINVFIYLWEPLILAIGLSLLPMIIKIFLEEFFFRRTDLPPLPVRRVFLYVCAAVLLVATLCMLGAFRAREYERSAKAKSQDIMQAIRAMDDTNEIDERRPGDPIKSPTVADQEATVSSTPGIVPPNNANGSVSMDGFTTWTFILLTLTLSLAGAVLFSSGWNRLSQAHQYRHLQRRISKDEAKYTIASEDRTGIESWIQDVEKGEIPYLKSPGYLAALIPYRLNAYKHGYERGYVVPETLHDGENIYSWCKRAVVRRLAGKLRLT